MDQFNRIINWQNEAISRESNTYIPSPRSPNESSEQRFPAVRLFGTNIRPYQEGFNATSDQNNLGAFPSESFGREPVERSISASPSSLPVSAPHMFQIEPFRPNSNILHQFQRSGRNNSTNTPNNDPNAVDELHSTQERVGNNRFSNQNVMPSSHLSLYGPHSNSSPAVSAINSGGYVEEEQGGVNSTSENMRLLPLKRRSDEIGLTEFAMGESSNTRGAEATRIPKRRLDDKCSEVNVNDSTSPCSGNNGHSVHSVTGIGHSTAWPGSRSNEASVNLSPTRNMRSHSLPSSQRDHSPSFNHEETQVGRFGLEHPMESAHYFPEPRNAPYASSYSVMEGRNEGMRMAPSHGTRNNSIGGNFMGPQIGREHNWERNGNAGLFGSSSSSNQYRSVLHTQPSSDRSWVHRVNPITASNSVPPSTGLPREINHDPQRSQASSRRSRRRNLYIGYISGSQLRSLVRIGNGLGDVGSSSRHTRTSSSRNPRFDVDMVLDEVRNAIDSLRNGGSSSEDSLTIHDSNVSNLPIVNWQSSSVYYISDLQINSISDHLPYEVLLALQDLIGNVETGLSEEQILSHIGRENFKSITDDGTPQDEACSICQYNLKRTFDQKQNETCFSVCMQCQRKTNMSQLSPIPYISAEDYVDGEELGKLDCRHKYHTGCIKQWLVLKNNCPICKQTALAVADN